MNGRPREDTHFYIDNASPVEVSFVLRVLSTDNPLTIDEIAAVLSRDYGYTTQKHHEFSPRRLSDLGLATQLRDHGLRYRLTERGLKLQNTQVSHEELARDLLHYLHYSGYTGSPSDRKYLWTYRRCCELVWADRHWISPELLAATIQTAIRDEFPELDQSARVGVRFSAKQASSAYTWLRYLTPPPTIERGKTLIPRAVDRYHLAILALDDTYRARGYRYGDAVLMDESLVSQVAGVFFLDINCCAQLLRLSARIVPFVRMSDTLSGTSINLLHRFSIDDLLGLP